MTNQNIIIAVVAAVLIFGAGFYVAKLGSSTTQLAGTTPSGGTTSTSHFYSIAVNLVAPGANATTSSILNSSANDYYITSMDVGCEGIGYSRGPAGSGYASLVVTAATSSTANPVINSNTNGAGIVTIATSTPTFVEASSTASTGSSFTNYIWAAGSYLTFTTNATNTALCTFGVKAFSS